MPNATFLFQPGWTLKQVVGVRRDVVTGNIISVRIEKVDGIGLLQESRWTGVTETTAEGVKDERLVLFAPTSKKLKDVIVTSMDTFEAPDKTIWQAITDGFARGIPGQPSEYIAVRVRRAKEKE